MQKQLHRSDFKVVQPFKMYMDLMYTSMREGRELSIVMIQCRMQRIRMAH